jgi:phenylalanyl-tRNA synthetase alpha chain
MLSADRDIQNLLDQVKDIAAQAAGLEALQQAESRLLGKKGLLGQLMGRIKDIAPDERASFGQKVNQAKAQATEVLEARRAELRAGADAADRSRATQFDPTLPGTVRPIGAVHPVTAVQWEIEDVFTQLGFVVADGPEMESEYHNFEALNIPKWHPARDMQDTFWLKNGMLLRTQTSAVQSRAMKQYGPPLRVIVPGRCFRYETVDASHETTFHQLEGLVVDRDISISNLIATMKLSLREVFKRDVEIRLRPGYFPFVEPGFELDMSCLLCGGTGCPACKQSGWIEVLPCGMVHPNVLRMGGIDPHEYTGFAFGLGLTRLAMMKYKIRDIRLLNSGDLRALVPADRLSGPKIGAS